MIGSGFKKPVRMGFAYPKAVGSSGGNVLNLSIPFLVAQRLGAISNDEVLADAPTGYQNTLGRWLLWHISADEGVTENGTYVTNLEDISPNPNAAVTGLAYLNWESYLMKGKPAFHFDGSRARLLGTIGENLNAPFTIVQVYKFKNGIQPAGDYDYCYHFGEAGSGVSFSRFAGTGNLYSHTGVVTMGPPLVGETWVASIMVLRDIPVNGSTVQVFLNGTQVDFSFAHKVKTNGGVNVGFYPSSRPLHFFAGQVAEMMIFRGAFGTSETTLLYNWLNEKYLLS